MCLVYLRNLEDCNEFHWELNEAVACRATSAIDVVAMEISFQYGLAKHCGEIIEEKSN